MVCKVECLRCLGNSKLENPSTENLLGGIDAMIRSFFQLLGNYLGRHADRESTIFI